MVCEGTRCKEKGRAHARPLMLQQLPVAANQFTGPGWAPRLRAPGWGAPGYAPPDQNL